MEFKSTFIAIVLISMMIIATGVVINGWNTEYNSGLESDLGAFDKLDDISDSASSQQGRINPASGEASSDYEASTFRGAYGIITNIFSPLRVIFGNDGLVAATVERFGLPDYVRQGLIAMMLFAIIFSIIAIVFRLGRDA